MIFKWNGVPPVHIAGHQHSWAMHQSENSRKNCHFLSTYFTTLNISTDIVKVNKPVSSFINWKFWS